MQPSIAQVIPISILLESCMKTCWINVVAFEVEATFKVNAAIQE